MLIPRRVGELEITSAALPAPRLPGFARFERLALGDVVGVAGLGGDREAGALGEPGERADEAVGQAAVLARVEEHLVDVPVGVVVGEDRRRAGPPAPPAARR